MDFFFGALAGTVIATLLWYAYSLRDDDKNI